MTGENKSTTPGSEISAKLEAATVTLKELVEKGDITADESIMAVAIGCGVMRLLKENKKPSVPADDVIMWLGQWRDSLPGQAVDDLQSICRRYGYGK